MPPNWPDKPVNTAVLGGALARSAGRLHFRDTSSMRFVQGMSMSVMGVGNAVSFLAGDLRYVVDVYRAGWP